MKKLAVLFDVEYHGNDWVGDTLPGIYLDIRLTLNVLAFDVKGREEILKSFSEMTVQFFNFQSSKRRIAIDDPVPVYDDFWFDYLKSRGLTVLWVIWVIKI